MQEKKAESRVYVTFLISTSLAIGLFAFLILELPTTLPHARKMAAALLLALTMVSFTSAIRFGKQSKANFALAAGSMVFWFLLGVIAVDIYGRGVRPGWPAVALHGVDPSLGKLAWGRIELHNKKAIGVNSWGQRDRQRAIASLPKTKRIAFVGDSFLEEGTEVPLPLLVEQKLGDGFEVVNLGVSSTSPTDYNARVRALAKKMGVQSVVCFFYLGNDFEAPNETPYGKPTWRERFFSAPPNEGSFGRVFPGLNYLITYRNMPAVRAWLAPRNLQEEEQKTLEAFRAAGPGALKESLVKFYWGDKDRLRETLSRREMGNFYSRLTAPDENLFRSFALDYGLNRAIFSVTPGTNFEATLANTVDVIKHLRDYCRDNDISFSMVLIPHAGIDPWLQDTWKPLFRFEEELPTLAQKTRALEAALQKERIEVLDLTPTFKGSEHNYLNFDLHWSQAGAERASVSVASFLRSQK